MVPRVSMSLPLKANPSPTKSLGAQSYMGKRGKSSLNLSCIALAWGSDSTWRLGKMCLPSKVKMGNKRLRKMEPMVLEAWEPCLTWKSLRGTCAWRWGSGEEVESRGGEVVKWNEGKRKWSSLLVEFCEITKRGFYYGPKWKWAFRWVSGRQITISPAGKMTCIMRTTRCT